MLRLRISTSSGTFSWPIDGKDIYHREEITILLEDEDKHETLDVEGLLIKVKDGKIHVAI